MIPAILVIAAPAIAAAAHPTAALAQAAESDEPVAPPSTTAGEPEADAESKGEDQASERAAEIVGFVIAEGQLTDHIGAGQGGVTVTARRKSTDGKLGELIATTTTDRVGDFTIVSPRRISATIVITFSKAQYQDSVREITVGDSDYPPFIAETLEGSLILSGQVLSALNDKPVPNAKITLKASYKDRNASTDEDGQFRMAGVLPGPAELIVEAADFGREHVALASIENAGALAVSLKPERVVHLKIVDSEGEPVSGVIAEALDAPRDDFRTTTSDETGSITLRRIHFDATSMSVRLTHEEYVSDQDFGRRIEIPGDKTESTHELAMRRAGRVAGRVTDMESGRPLSGARVMTGDRYTDLSPRDWADYRGAFTIIGVPPGPTTLTVHLSGYAPELAHVLLKAAETTNADFTLHPGATVTGSVRNQDGRPVPNALIEAVGWRECGTLGLRAVTDAEGRFAIHSAPWDAFEIQVSAKQGRRVTATVQAGRPAEITLVGAPDQPDQVARLSIGEAVPALKLITLDGATIDLGEHAGKTVLLDFWATWCGPCIAELPNLRKIYDRHGTDAGFLMIGVSLDDDEATLRRFLESNEIDWPLVIGDSAHAAAEAFGVIGIPAMYLIGPEGTLIAADIDAAAARERLGALPKGANP